MSTLLEWLSIFLIALSLSLIVIGLRLLLVRRYWPAALCVVAGITIGLMQAVASSSYWFSGTAAINVPYVTIVRRLGVVATALLLAVVAATGMYWFLRQPKRRTSYLASVAVLALPALVFGTMRSLSLNNSTTYIGDEAIPIPQVSDAERVIELPPGYQAGLLAELEGNPTALCIDDRGRLFISDVQGAVRVATIDETGAMGTPKLVLDNLNSSVGLAWFEDELYVSSAGRIDAFSVSDQGDVLASRVVVENLPAHVYVFHQNNQIAFGPDGRLYVGVGATSDSAPETAPLAASILSMNPDGTDLTVFATGLRNPYGVAFDRDGNLWVTDNGPTPEVQPTPADELNLVVEGGDYGFPAAYAVEWPEVAGILPVVEFPVHSAASGLLAYSGGGLTPGDVGALFVTTWNIGNLYRVQVQVENGVALQQTSLFARGFANPVAVAVDAQGRLLVADYGARAIFAISFPAGAH